MSQGTFTGSIWAEEANYRHPLLEGSMRQKVVKAKNTSSLVIPIPDPVHTDFRLKPNLPTYTGLTGLFVTGINYLGPLNINGLSLVPALPWRIMPFIYSHHFSFQGVGCRIFSSTSGLHHNSFARYHSTVSFKASSSECFGFHRSSFLIFDESRL